MYGLPPGYAQILQSPPYQMRAYALVYQRPWPPPAHFSAPNAWVGSELQAISPLPIESGTVTIDNTGVQRRRATLTVAPNSAGVLDQAPVLPTSVNSPLTPYRNMVLLYYAVAPMSAPPLPFANPPPDAYLLGIFTLTDVAVAVTKAGDVTMQLELQDMSQDVSRRVLQVPYVTQNGVPMTEAIKDILTTATRSGRTIPWFQFTPTSALTSGGQGPDTLYAAGYTWDEGQDPWQAAQQMAESIGYQLYFTPTGVCLGTPIPNPAALESCWTYAMGVPDVVDNITGLTRTFSQSQVYNYVEMVVEGANANPSPDLLYVGTSFLAQIGDTDPTSPTNIHGPFGISADVQFDMLNFQPATALLAAKARLRRGLGQADMVTFTALPNPAHEAYDRITVKAPRIGLQQDYFLDTIEIPLEPGSEMTITGRRVVNIP
jgi:hypothetical protein